ncbi:MAG: hemolysin family protein, partial [Gemmatimonadota bacterium]
MGLASIFLLVLLNAFFVAAEFALVGARRTRLEELAEAGDRRSMLALKIARSLPRYIGATQIGITLCSLALGWLGEPALASIMRLGLSQLPAQIGPVVTLKLATPLAFTVITFLLILLGELLPKSLALVHPERLSGWVAAPLLAFSWVAWPAIWVLNGAANRVLKLLHFRPLDERQQRMHSPEEIRMLVEQSQVGGSLETTDARLLEGVFEFSEKTAREVMTPRTQMLALAADLTVEEAADAVARGRRSRYPVYAGSLDEIIGVVHAKDVLTALRAHPGSRLADIMRPPLFVPGTREVEDVLADMKRLKTHLAVVLDEYGGTAGLVTMEDLLEEIVGDIFDEHDRAERPSRSDAAGLLVEGSKPLTDLNTELDLTLEDPEYSTLGGYLFGQLGRLPRIGDRVTVGRDLFEITDMDNRRVKTVRYLPGAAAATTAESVA